MARHPAVTELIESGYFLGTIETPFPERVVRLFTKHERTNGEALYIWRPGTGLCRVGMEFIKIPRTATLGEALEFVSSTIHFGIFLILGAGKSLVEDGILTRLRRFSRSQTRVRQLLLFVDTEIPQVAELQALTLQLRHDMRRTG